MSAPSEDAPPAPLVVGVLVCLLLSGAAGLIYETVWTRQLAYVYDGRGEGRKAVAAALKALKIAPVTSLSSRTSGSSDSDRETR